MQTGITDILAKARRKLLLTRTAETMAIAATFALLAASAVRAVQLVAGLWLSPAPGAAMPAWAVPSVMLAAALAIACIYSIARRPSAREAAVLLDRNARMAERMSTACELLGSPRRDLPSSQVVFAQALKVSAERQPLRQPMWRRTSATAGALLLAAGLCAVLSFVPVAGQGQAPPQLRAAMENLTEQDRADLARSVSKAAVVDDKRAAELMSAAASAIAAGDADALARAVEELRKLGYSPAGYLPPQLAGAVGTGSGAGDGGMPTTAVAATGPTGSAPSTAQQVPYVMAPDVPPRSTGTATDTTAPALAAQRLVPLDQAWQQARAAAAAAIESGTTPPKYRRLVRDYFAAGED